MKSFSRFGVAALTAGLLSVLVACGGGGGDGPEQAQAASVGGVWSANFTAANGNAIQAKFLITEDGRFFGASQNLSNNCVGISYGSLGTSGSNFTGSAVGALAQASVGGSIPACVYPDGTTSSTSTVAGSVVQRSSITITATATSSSGLALGIDDDRRFDTLYNAGSSLKLDRRLVDGSHGNPRPDERERPTGGLDGRHYWVCAERPGVDSSTRPTTPTRRRRCRQLQRKQFRVEQFALIKALMFIDNTTTPNKLFVERGDHADQWHTDWQDCRRAPGNRSRNRARKVAATGRCNLFCGAGAKREG